ncbi:MAG: DUF167 domain-containing protein [Treponema sp.]|jgi:uncharacterized protein (TIGR00251 family)|nr:DUF167 domain-containing protein [Treponema sp.]
METCIRPGEDMLFLDIKVQPGASKNELTGIREGRLRIKISAPPEDGKANGELISFLAKTLDCAKKEIRILSGEKSRIKTLGIPSKHLEALEKVLGKL